MIPLGSNRTVIRSFGLSDVGAVRATNQDRWFIDDGQGAFLVADGVGGLGRGEEAAETAIEACRQFLEASRPGTEPHWPFGYDAGRSRDANRLVNALKLANQQVQRRGEQVPDRSGMGTTLVALLVDGHHATVANVGDSRAYLWRDGVLRQLSVDDKWVAQMVRHGALSEEEAQTHPMRNVLTQSIGTQPQLDVHTHEFELRGGDQVLLSSDGFHEVAGDQRLAEMLARGLDPEQTVRQLLSTVLALGAPDNTTAILAQVEERA